MRYALGSSIGETKSAVSPVSPDKEHMVFLERKSIPTHGTRKKVLDYLADIGRVSLETHRVSKEKCCFDISYGGSLDNSRGVIPSLSNPPGWDQVLVTSYLARHLGMDTRFKSDTDTCVLAEWRYGAGKSYRRMIFLTFGTGLGTGLILNGGLYEGVCGMAGKTGYIRLVEDGPMDYTKAGSFEGFYSGGGIARLARSIVEGVLMTGRVVSYMKDRGLEGVTIRDVAKTADMGYVDARNVPAVSGRYLDRGLAMLVDILNPERIVAGGIYAETGRFLKEEIEKESWREALLASADACCILSSDLGEQIGGYGAVMAAMEIREE